MRGLISTHKLNTIAHFQTFEVVTWSDPVSLRIVFEVSSGADPDTEEAVTNHPLVFTFKRK